MRLGCFGNISFIETNSNWIAQNGIWLCYRGCPCPSSHPSPLPSALYDATSLLWGWVRTWRSSDEEKVRPDRHTAQHIICGHIFTHASSVSFGFQRVSLSDRDPRGGTDVALEVNPEPETNLTLLQTDRQVWRQTPRDPHGMINKYARHTHTHTHTPSCWHLDTSFSPRLLSLCSLFLLPYTCLTCVTASFVISNHLLFERLWQTGVLVASVWCWELGFPVE